MLISLISLLMKPVYPWIISHHLLEISLITKLRINKTSHITTPTRKLIFLLPIIIHLIVIKISTAIIRFVLNLCDHSVDVILNQTALLLLIGVSFYHWLEVKVLLLLLDVLWVGKVLLVQWRRMPYSLQWFCELLPLITNILWIVHQHFEINHIQNLPMNVLIKLQLHFEHYIASVLIIFSENVT